MKSGKYNFSKWILIICFFTSSLTAEEMSTYSKETLNHMERSSIKYCSSINIESSALSKCISKQRKSIIHLLKINSKYHSTSRGDAAKEAIFKSLGSNMKMIKGVPSTNFNTVVTCIQSKGFKHNE